MSVIELGNRKLDEAKRGMKYGLPGFGRSNIEWWTGYIEGAEDQKREDEQPAYSWHRVEEELPDLLQFVVVCNDEGKCVVAQYVGYQTDSLTPWRIAYTMYDTDIYDETECGPVRYWIPIEPPKEDA